MEQNCKKYEKMIQMVNNCQEGDFTPDLLKQVKLEDPTALIIKSRIKFFKEKVQEKNETLSKTNDISCKE